MFHLKGEVAVVQQVMMGPAQQHTVRHIGNAAGFPPFDVMGIAPGRGRGALRPDAAPIAGRQCYALCTGKESLRAPERENFSVGAETHHADVRVASEFPNARARHRFVDTVEPPYAAARVVVLCPHGCDDGCS